MPQRREAPQDGEFSPSREFSRLLETDIRESSLSERVDESRSIGPPSSSRSDSMREEAERVISEMRNVSNLTEVRDALNGVIESHADYLQRLSEGQELHQDLMMGDSSGHEVEISPDLDPSVRNEAVNRRPEADGGPSATEQSPADPGRHPRRPGCVEYLFRDYNLVADAAIPKRNTDLELETSPLRCNPFVETVPHVLMTVNGDVQMFNYNVIWNIMVDVLETCPSASSRDIATVLKHLIDETYNASSICSGPVAVEGFCNYVNSLYAREEESRVPDEPRGSGELHRQRGAQRLAPPHQGLRDPRSPRVESSEERRRREDFERKAVETYKHLFTEDILGIFAEEGISAGEAVRVVSSMIARGELPQSVLKSGNPVIRTYGNERRAIMNRVLNRVSEDRNIIRAHSQRTEPEGTAFDPNIDMLTGKPVGFCSHK